MQIELSEETTRKLVIDILTKDAEILVTMIISEMVTYSNDPAQRLDNMETIMRHLYELNRVIEYYGGEPVKVGGRYQDS